MTDHRALTTLRTLLNEHDPLVYVSWGDVTLGTESVLCLWLQLPAQPTLVEVSRTFSAREMQESRPRKQPWFRIAWAAADRLQMFPDLRMRVRIQLESVARRGTHEETRPGGAPAAPLADWGIDTRQEDAGASGDDPCGE